MKNVVENFKSLALRLKELGAEGADLCFNLYDLSEQVIMVDGVGGFEKEYALLKEIIDTTEPVAIVLGSETRNEKYAWKEMMTRALDKGVVDDLTEAQKEGLIEYSGKSDDGLDIWILDNLDDLSANQINQIYLAQVIGFYYYYPSMEEFSLDNCGRGLGHLFKEDE